MFCITTSTKYDDILKIIMPQNYRFFDKWYIVTDFTDQKTIDVIKEYNYPNVEMILFDFTKDGRIFNKGGAIRMVQQMIPTGKTVLLLDSDIYLPDNFLEVLPPLEHDKLYSSDQRQYFYSYSSFMNNKPDRIDRNYFFGFFQLYTQSPERLYEESKDASHCDNQFKWAFYNNPEEIYQVRIYNLELKHLGGSSHWFGRNTSEFKIIE